MTYRILTTPLGALTLVSDAAGQLTGVYFEGQKHHPEVASFGNRDDMSAPEAAAQLTDYFDGRRDAFELFLAPSGTEFQQRVWAAISEIPAGETRTYGQLAELIGAAPGASRAVGAAVGRNPISIIIPCHRVVGSSGQLTGYAGGLERKQWLLAHEAR